MKINFQILAAILFLTAINGCTISLSCVLLNNTQETLTIQQFDNADKAEKNVTLSPGKTVCLKSWSFLTFKITSKRGTWGYRNKYPANRFIHFPGWGPWTKKVFYAQIEPDGLIYILADETMKPVDHFPAQPDGFPIRPEVNLE